MRLDEIQHPEPILANYGSALPAAHLAYTAWTLTNLDGGVHIKAQNVRPQTQSIGD